MKKTGILILLLLGWLLPSQAYGFADETLNYVVQYKWGLVHKDAGNATLRLKNSGNNYQVSLTAKTLPWADKIFEVRDTLRSTIQKDGLKPLSYSKTTHEGGKYAKDVITYKHNGNNISATTQRYKVKKGKRTEKTYSFTGTNPAYDMLSIFYYLRSVDFNKLAKGSSMKVTMFSGKKKELLTFKNMGLETLKLRNGTKREAYKLSFTFSENGRAGSSDAMQVWISADSRHIPLQIVGNLSIGQVRCYYTGG